MKQFLLLLFTCTLLSLSTDAFAGEKNPQLVGSASLHYSGTNYSISMALGESITISTLTPEGGATIGFLQPNLTKLAVGIQDYSIVSTPLLLYPNPATDKIYWNANDKEVKKLTIFAVNGNKVFEIQPSMPELTIDFLAQGIYHVQMSNKDGRILHNFKLVKN